MNFAFFSPVNIIFGQAAVMQLADCIDNLLIKKNKNNNIVRKNVLLITGKNTNRADIIINQLKLKKIPYNLISQFGEPCIDDIVRGTNIAKQEESSIVVAIGGGSVIDYGKAVAALAANSDNIMEYIEIIGKGTPIISEPLPMIAIPTTSGTGAEVTCNAVISSLEHKVKVSLRSSLMYPDIAVIDPGLTLELPPDITATTGMDALTQLIESFTSKFANPITDALCREGLARIGRSFKKAYIEPDNIDARADMSFASLLSGITLSNAKLGAVHGIASPMGGMLNASHGLICASLLPFVISTNIKTAQELLQNKATKPNNFTTTNSLINKYCEIAYILTKNPNAECNDLVNYINELTRFIKIKETASKCLPTIDPLTAELIAEQSKESSSMKGNPVDISLYSIQQIIRKISA